MNFVFLANQSKLEETSNKLTTSENLSKETLEKLRASEEKCSEQVSKVCFFFSEILYFH